MLKATIEGAEQAAREGRWRDAIKAFVRLAEEQEEPDFLLEAALAAAEGDLPDEAERLFRHVIALQPANAHAYTRLAFLLNASGRLQEAEATLQSVLAIEERQVALTLLGSVRRRLGNAQAAIAPLQRSIELRPHDDEAHFELGMALQDSEPMLAVAHFQRAHELDPLLPHVLREMAWAFWKADRLPEAEEACRRALSADPSDAWAHDYLGNLLLARGDFSSAKLAFEAALKSEPENGFFWGNLARACEELGQTSEADRNFRKGLSVELHDAYLHTRYGLFLKGTGQPAKAARYLRRALRLDPKQEKARIALEQLAR